jgi:hypothetical protein|tara:strand:+ start:1690 stop:2613 length:924 start_codon:yes stop_codon:yes gene_type:complete
LKWKRWASIATILLLTVGVAWTYLVVSYESPLGTDNRVLVKDPNGALSNGTMDDLATLSFAEGGEDLAWTSLQIEIIADEQQYTCSFGSQSTEDLNEGNVVATLGADGSTFTTIIDATEDTFTYLDVPNQLESNISNHTMRFSTTDIFFSEGVQWAFLEGQTIGEITSANSTSWSNETNDRLEWYTYDIAVHRVSPIEGTYLILEDSVIYKIQFLTYYNEEDESRFPTMLISTLDKTEFPALNNPNLVVPSPCLIQSGDETFSHWNATETITLLENGMNICSSPCSPEIIVLFETTIVKIENIESFT